MLPRKIFMYLWVNSTTCIRLLYDRIYIFIASNHGQMLGGELHTRLVTCDINEGKFGCHFCLIFKQKARDVVVLVTRMITYTTL